VISAARIQRRPQRRFDRLREIMQRIGRTRVSMRVSCMCEQWIGCGLLKAHASFDRFPGQESGWWIVAVPPMQNLCGCRGRASNANATGASGCLHAATAPGFGFCLLSCLLLVKLIHTPLFSNIRCFKFVKQIYLNIFYTSFIFKYKMF
jgi:hypothetical protein